MKKQIPEKQSTLQRAVPNIIEETIAQNPIWKINMKQILQEDERDKRTRKPWNRSKLTRTRGLRMSLRYSKQWEGVIREEMVPSLRIWEKNEEENLIVKRVALVENWELGKIPKPNPWKLRRNSGGRDWSEVRYSFYIERRRKINY